MSDFTNINDPAGVQALLESLRKSQAWQDLEKDTCHSDEPNTAIVSKDSSQAAAVNDVGSSSTVMESVPAEEVAESSSNILSLLSRLQPTLQADTVAPRVQPFKHDEMAHMCINPNPPRKITGILKNANGPVSHEKTSRIPSAGSSASVRNMSFTQALPVIANLASDPSVHQKLKKIREQQDSLERRLWEERNQIFRSQEEKIKVHQTRAAITGVNISEQEIKKIEASFMDEIRKFDAEKALTAWDSLVTSQQRMLEELGVPGMFVTTDKVEREKQQRIIQVLEGLASPDDIAHTKIEASDEEP